MNLALLSQSHLAIKNRTRIVDTSFINIFIQPKMQNLQETLKKFRSIPFAIKIEFLFTQIMLPEQIHPHFFRVQDNRNIGWQ